MRIVILFLAIGCCIFRHNFLKEKTIVLGYGAYEKVKNSFLNKLIRFETMIAATQYFSWAKIGKPYMGVGRNLAYKRDEFFKVRGFQDHMKIRSGDDDLFINQAATKHNTAILYTPKSFTLSEPKKTFKTWFYQKRRHTTTAKYYKGFDKFQLGLFFFSQFWFLILAIILLAFQFEWMTCFKHHFISICIRVAFIRLCRSKIKRKRCNVLVSNY